MGADSIDLIIREAIPEDAGELLSFVKETAEQTDFLTMDAEYQHLTIEEEAKQLARLYESDNNCLLAALDGERIIGIATVSAANDIRMRHIGDIGIVVHKEYWGLGLGTVLMEEVLSWAEDSGILKRLQLQVQERNTRARKLYEKLGFQTEAVMQRGVCIKGEYLPVCFMSRMIGDV